MLKKRSGFIFIFSLFFLCLLFSEETGTAGDEILSLQQIDILIESTAYNEALKELTKYINAYPNDFDRAHKRVMKVFKAREKYNKDGEELVELIRDGDDTKVDKLYKITELESSELDSTETVVDFTNLARRTVTLGEVLIHYNRIMKEGVALVKKEKFPEAALKFEEGFAIKNEFSDIVFDPKDLKNSEGIPVVYENDITDPVKKSIGTIRSLVAGSLLSAGFSSRESDCEKAYNEFIKAVSAKNVDIDEVQKSFKRVNTAFSKLAELHNKIIDEAEKLQQVVELAEQRNSLLLGTSYISFQLKFVAGDSSHPDTGVIGAIEAYYNKRIESMKEKTGAIVFSILNETIKKLPEEKIYSLADKIDSERNSMKLSRDFAQTAISLHELYKLEKTLDAVSFGEKYPDYEKSMKFVYEYISGLSLAYESVKDLAYERKNPEKINTSFVNQNLLSENLQKLLRYEKIKSDSRSYLKLIDDEKKRESEYFANLEKREREIAELVELSGGTLKISTLKKRETAGTRISDSPLDFRNQIDYFTSISRQNLDESSAHALGLWEYMSRGYMTLSRDSFDDFSKQCSDTEILLYGAGSQDDEDNFDFQESVFSEFVKHYPVEARENAEKLNSRISAKREEFLSQLEFLYKGKDDYWNVSENYKNSTLEFERIIKNFDTLYARNYVVIDKASVQIRQYEAVLADANEQFNRASDLYKKGDYKNAMLAVDAASEKYAGALEIEYSEKIRSVREVSLTELAMKIQRAEFERVLRSVFALKDRASTFYYSGNFDNAENVLLSAQLQWATVSSEPDPEIENLLAIVKNIKNIENGRVLLSSDPHYSDLSSSLDRAKQRFEEGVALKKSGNEEAAKLAFEKSLENIRNVQNIYPLNKTARLLNLKIQRETDPEGFPRNFENNYNAAKLNENKTERLAELEDLYEINPSYPGLAQEIYNLKDSLGMFPKKVTKSDTKKQFNEKFASAKSLFKTAGNDEDKLKKALDAINEAINLDPGSKEAKNLKLEIQLKIGVQSTAILSQNDEKMYSEAARLFNQRRFSDAKVVMDKLMTGKAAQKSRKVLDLYNRLLKRL